ncbi:alpha/beta hydrolase [Gloeocapsopsis crepidinum]|uniref:alpha/beta hydrolase n=1 Tax=Gloeocapsopsis crepidinum TaxID=693223 RepID=UPI003F71C93E
MSDYSNITAALVRETRTREKALPLMNDNCRSRFLLQAQRTDKVGSFFHGFTATPEQFFPIAEAFFQAGYNVVVPLLPGHGLAGNWDSDNPPPLPEEQHIYQRFGLYWLEQVQALGKQVVIGGLSGGSTLAAWLALECPESIHRALLFAPYLSNSNLLVDFIVKIMPIYFQWRTEEGAISYGYDGFVMPALRVFMDMGQDLLERAKNSIAAAPCFVISSERDRAVDDNENQDLYESLVKLQPKCWYYSFDKVFDIPHNMMTKAEGNDYQDLVFAVAKAYVGSDVTWQEVEEITYQMLFQGKTFDAVVQERNFTQRVCPDLQTLISLLDKPAIVAARQSKSS